MADNVIQVVRPRQIVPKLLLYLVVVHCAFAAPLWAQAQDVGCLPVSGIACNGGQCEDLPAEQHFLAFAILKRHSISPTRYGLVAALQLSEGTQIRYLAAWQLADQDLVGQRLEFWPRMAGDVDYDTPVLAQALDAEHDPRAKMYIACAVAELNDPRGVQALQRGCEDTAYPTQLRLDVVNFLLELHERPCVSAVIEGVKEMGLQPGLMSTWFTMDNLKDDTQTNTSKFADFC